MFLSQAALWGLAAAVPAVGVEYLYRTLPGPWVRWLWVWLPAQLLIGYCVYRMVTAPGTTLIDAFVVWAFATIFLRVLASLALGDVVKTGTWIALGLIVLARAVQTYWGR